MEIRQEPRRSEITCRTATIDSFYYGSFHWHENYEICQVLKKNASFRVAGDLIEANAGDIVTIKDRTIHQFLISTEKTELRIFQFSTRILLNATSNPTPLKVHITREEIAAIPDLEQKLNTLFAMMDAERRAPKAEENPFFTCLASTVYMLLERHFSVPVDDASNQKEKQEFYRMVEYLNTHFKEDVTVNSISKEFYMSRGRLSAIFKKHAGASITEYVNSLRITHANYLLANGSGATEAALESGFQSIRTFNNVYKNARGMTPSEYTKNPENTLEQ